MKHTTLPAREQQALLEVGKTAVSPATARVMSLFFLATIAAVGLVQIVVGPSPHRALGDFRRSVSEAPRIGSDEGPLAGNRQVLAALDTLESRIEDESLLRRHLLPPVQLAVSGWLRAGNEQVYVGRGGWLFYRPDVDHLIGPAFLDADVMERRRRSGQAWEAPPEPDPVPAIVELARDLKARGIELLVMPTPVKPMLLPGALVWRRTEEPPLRNPSWPTFRRSLEDNGVSVLDAAAWMAAIPSTAGVPYLVTDTHWTPAAMEQVARRMAQEISDRLPLAPTPEFSLQRRATTFDGRGDISTMLRLPESQTLYPPQRVTTWIVTEPDGSAWRPAPNAAVLILGDSFTNVFSEAGLGWGQGAGLAEQVSYFLARPVDRIAQNAGGSNASRRALAAALVADPERLASTKIVVYQFSSRELTHGDWPVVRLPAESP